MQETQVFIHLRYLKFVNLLPALNYACNLYII